MLHIPYIKPLQARTNTDDSLSDACDFNLVFGVSSLLLGNDASEHGHSNRRNVPNSCNSHRRIAPEGPNRHSDPVPLVTDSHHNPDRSSERRSETSAPRAYQRPSNNNNLNDVTLASSSRSSGLEISMMHGEQSTRLGQPNPSSVLALLQPAELSPALLSRASTPDIGSDVAGT